jgi:hypothetical protein
MGVISGIFLITAALSVGAGVAHSVYQRASGWMSGVWFVAGVSFSLLHSVQTGSVFHPASYPVGTKAPKLVVKRQEEADYLLPSMVEVKNGGAIPPLLYTN